jgi:HK97 family phage portal protein
VSLLGSVMRRSTLRDPAEWLYEALAGVPSASGVRVTQDSALGIPSVYAAVSLVADAVGSLPLKVFRSVNGGKEEAPDHPVFSLLHDLPNPEITAVEMRSALQGHLMLRGNGYCEIQRDTSNRPVALWPLNPSQMTVTRDAQRNLVYLYRLPDGQDAKWTWRNPRTMPAPILHVRGFGSDAYYGYAPLTLHRETLGLANAAREYGARFFSNGARPSGVLKAPGELSDEARARLKAAWDATTRGLSNAHRVAVLEQGIEWQQVGINPEDAQMVTTLNLTDAQVAMIFRVPPHMIGQVERSTSWGTGIEQQQTAFLQYSLMPWLVRWEQALARDLLSVKGFATHSIRFVVQGMLRGDMASRSAFYQSMLDRGVFSINEVRALEDRNSIGALGDQRYLMGNLMPLGETPVVPDDDDRPLTGEEPEGVM